MKRFTIDRLAATRWYPALLLGIVFVLHLPAFAFAVFDNDEAYIATATQVLNRGGHLYQQVVDRKPPGVFYLYDWVFWLLHTEALWAPRMLGVLAHTATAIFVWLIARKRFGARAGVLAGLLSALSSTLLLPADAQSANFEVFMMPFILLAFWLADREQPAWSGFALGVATMMKQTAAITLIPLAWMAWRVKRIRSLAALAVAFAIPIVACALIFGPHEFWFWVFGGANGGYLTLDGAYWQILTRLLFMTGAIALLNFGALMLLRPAWRDRRNDIDLWLWLVSGLIGVVSGTRFFGHYYWQVLPPICVLAGHGLADASRQALKRSFVSAGVCAGGIVTAAFLMPIVTPNRNYQDIAEYAVAHTQTDQRIFVWGHLPSVYWAANRLPATRIVTTGFLTGHTSARPASAVNMKAAVPGLWPEVLHDLNQHPPVLVFDTLAEETPGDADYPIAKFPPFAKFLSQHYQVVDVIDRTVVYRRIGT